LLNHSEQILWKLIRENGYVWKGRYNSDGEWIWRVSAESPVIDRIREHWETFKAAAQGDADAVKKLPTWRKQQSAEDKAARKKGKFDDMEDDIPF
jgi:hypothetical protein